MEQEAKNVLGIDLVSIENIVEQDAIIIAVGHREYCRLKIVDWEKMLTPNGVIIDVKSIYNSKIFHNTSFSYWSL